MPSRTVLNSAILALALAAGSAIADSAQVDAIYPGVEALYIDLHRNPELAFHERRTAANPSPVRRRRRSPGTRHSRRPPIRQDGRWRGCIWRRCEATG